MRKRKMTHQIQMKYSKDTMCLGSNEWRGEGVNLWYVIYHLWFDMEVLLGRIEWNRPESDVLVFHNFDNRTNNVQHKTHPQSQEEIISSNVLGKTNGEKKDNKWNWEEEDLPKNCLWMFPKL